MLKSPLLLIHDFFKYTHKHCSAVICIQFQNFFIALKTPHPLAAAPHSPSPSVPDNRYFLPLNLLVPDISCNEIIQDVGLCVWLLSLSLMFSRLI